MSASQADSKAGLRTRLLAALRGLSAAERTEGSRAICQQLRRLSLWREAQSILVFAPTPLEPDITPLISEALASRKSVALPRYRPGDDAYEACAITDLQHDLAAGKYGILEPMEPCPVVSPKKLDLVLTPGLGFSPSGGRLGRGKGYYDRLLPSIPGVKCGVGFDCQLTAEVPVESHDVVLDCILTPTRWLRVTSRGRS